MNLSLLSAILSAFLFQQPASLDSLDLHNVKAEAASYRGRNAIRIVDIGPPELGDAGRLAIVRGSSFQNGLIEADLTGDTLPTAAPTARGFVGIAFRVASDAGHFECIYLRPKNGRANDQLQRNHSTQYISVPGFPWEKLRAETRVVSNRSRSEPVARCR
jgi:hypothetical protein